MNGGIEVIEFVRPSEMNSLFISGFSEGTCSSDITVYLHQKLSSFGLLYGIITPDMLPCHPESGPPYALASFYSNAAAHQAQRELAGRLVYHGKVLKVNPAKTKKVKINTQKTLYVTKCYELANHYLGFNGWSTKIISMKVDSSKAAELDVACYRCVTELTVPCHGVTVKGSSTVVVPYSSTELSSKSVAICRAKKRAYQEAVEAAFGQLVLAVLPSGKVYVDVKPTTSEIIPEELEELKTLKVTELDEDPHLSASSEEEEGESFNDIDLDNVQLLQELAEDFNC